MLKKLWDRWKRISHAVGNLQARVLLTVFYVLLVIPTGLVVRLVSDPLGLRRPVASYWVSRPATDETLSGATREF